MPNRDETSRDETSRDETSRDVPRAVEQNEELNELKLEVPAYHLPVRSPIFYCVIFIICSVEMNIRSSGLRSNSEFAFLIPTIISVAIFIIIVAKPAPTWSLIHFTRDGKASCARYKSNGLISSFWITIAHFTYEFWNPRAGKLSGIVRDFKNLRDVASRLLEDLSPDLAPLIKRALGLRERPRYFELKDVQSIKISSHRVYSDSRPGTIELSKLIWHYLKTDDVEFRLTLTFSDGLSLSGRCVIPGVNSRQRVIQLAAQISSIAGIEWGELRENTPYTYVAVFDRGLTTRGNAKSSEIRSYMMNVSSLSRQALNTLNTNDQVSDHHQPVTREERVDEPRPQEGLMIHEKQVDGSEPQERFMLREKRISDESRALQPDDLSILDQLITAPWDAKRDLFDGHVITHTARELIYEQRKNRSLYYVLTWLICVLVVSTSSAFFTISDRDLR